MADRATVSFSRRRFLRSTALTAAALTLPALAGTAFAADDPRLARARAKGKVTWYSATFPQDMRNALAKGFTARTGIPLSVYGAGGNQVVSRVRLERSTGSYDVDVLDAGDLELFDGLIKDGIIRQYRPKGAEEISPAFKDPHGYYYGEYFWTLVLEYNTKVYNRSTAPSMFEDLINPSFKGKLVMPDPARSTAGLGFVKAMVKSDGWSWIEQLVKNAPLVLAISSGIEQIIVGGERPIAIETSQFTSKSLQMRAPVAIGGGEFLFGSPDFFAMVTKAPNPDGAELFGDYLVSKDSQGLIRKYGPYAVRVDVPPPYGMPPINKLKLRYGNAPTLDMPAEQVAQRFHALLQAAK